MQIELTFQFEQFPCFMRQSLIYIDTRIATVSAKCSPTAGGVELKDPQKYWMMANDRLLALAGQSHPEA